MKSMKRLHWFVPIIGMILVSMGCAAHLELLTPEGYPLPPYQELLISPGGELKVVGYLASYQAKGKEFGLPKYLKVNNLAELPPETTHLFFFLWVRNDSGNQYLVKTQIEVYHQEVGWFLHEELFQNQEKKPLIIEPTGRFQYFSFSAPIIKGQELKFRVVFVEQKTGYPILTFGDALYKIKEASPKEVSVSQSD